MDNVTLELRADDVQPSRFNWSIRVASLLDTGGNGVRGVPGTVKKGPHLDGTRIATPPELNYRFPILILGFVVLSVVIFLLCRKSKNDKKKQLAGDAIPNIGTRELPEIDEEVRARRPTLLQPGQIRRGNDLLDTTVYATSASAVLPSYSQSTMSRNKASTFESVVGERRLGPITLGPAYHSTALSAVTAAAAAASTAAANTNNPAGPSNPRPVAGGGKSARLNDNQYWV